MIRIVAMFFPVLDVVSLFADSSLTFLISDIEYMVVFDVFYRLG
jgi:hypothetical protein